MVFRGSQSVDGGSVVVDSDTKHLSVIQTDPHTDPRWETFVLQHPAGSIYFHPAWLGALEREYGRKVECLVCEDSRGELQGLFPLMYTRGIPFSKGKSLSGARLASLPRTPFGGPLANGSPAAALLLQAAVRRVSALPNVSLQIKPQERGLDGLISGVVEKPWRYNYLLHFHDTPGEPFNFSNSKHRGDIRRSINKARANGLRIRMAETEADLSAWYSAYLETMRRNIVPARPYRFFRALWQLMRPKGLIWLWLVEHESNRGVGIVGGHIYFRLGNTLTYAFSAARTKALPLHPNDMLLWQAIHDAHAAGCSTVDFGEVPEGDESLAQYKTKWGAKPVRMYRYYYPDFAESEPPTDDGQSPLMAIAKSAWCHLPLKVTAWLGDRKSVV